MQLTEVVGQPVATRTLMRALKSQRISHAYLFYGERGMGKETIAKSFINHLLCEDNTACGTCGSCLKLAHGNHPGISVIEGDTSIKIDQIRELKEQIQLTNTKHKVWLIRDVEKMTVQAANSFLKILEEPPRLNIFILLTNNIRQILPTIRSRCQTITFTRLTDNQVLGLLNQCVNVAEVEDQQRLSVTIKMARGSIGKALELWEGQLLERRNWVLEQMISLPEMSIAQILGLSHSWSEDRDQVKVDLEMMLQWYRDLWCAKLGLTDNIYNFDHINELTNISCRYSPTSLEHITNLIQDMAIQIQRNVRIRFILGHLLLQMKKGALA